MTIMSISIKADPSSKNGRSFFRAMHLLGTPFTNDREDNNPTIRLFAFLEPVARRVLAVSIDLEDAGYNAEVVPR